MNEPVVEQPTPEKMPEVKIGMGEKTGSLVICFAEGGAIIAGASREDSIALANDILNWTPPIETPA